MVKKILDLRVYVEEGVVTIHGKFNKTLSDPEALAIASALDTTADKLAKQLIASKLGL